MATSASSTDGAVPETAEASTSARTLQKTMTDPRFERAQALLKAKRLEEAVVVSEDLLRTMCETEQLGDTLAVAPVYYQYGHAILSLAEATASLFGGAVAGASSGGEASGDAEQDARNAADDLEVAWEMLELARVVYARYPGDLTVETQLARVYTRLGDLGLESDQFEQARADFERALLLRRKVLTATKDLDTTPLADLYCSLAISCIYRDASTPADEKKEDEEAEAELDSAAKRDAEGLAYYVLAGRVMAENVHRVASQCSTSLQEFVAKRVPKYALDDDTEPTVAKGKGKRKASAADAISTRSLLFTGANAANVKEELLACVKADKKSEETDVTLGEDEEELLEFLEIYVELKEKVDGLKETQPAKREGESNKFGAGVTTIGFGAAGAATEAKTAMATATSAVNMVPAVKKRKAEAPAAPTDGK